MKITSVNNDLIKEVTKLQQRKYRDESGLFLLEGDKSIEEAIEYGIKIKHLFIKEGYDKFNNIDCKIEVSETVLTKISTTTTPPKTVAVGLQQKNNWNDSNTIIIPIAFIRRQTTISDHKFSL